MKLLIYMLAAGVLLAALLPRSAAATQLPYDSFAWQYMPESPDWPSPEERQLRYPDWSDDAVLSLGYREQQTYYYGTRGLVSLRTSRQAWLSILHYSADGNCYIVLSAGQLSPRQLSTFSVELGHEQQGITRVMVWDRPASPQLLQALASQQGAEEAVAGLLQQSWFPRSNRRDTGLPYEPGQYRVYENPPSFALTDVPAVRSQLSLDYITYSKDCFVEFDGRMSIGADEWGTRGQWILSWGNTLRMEVYLPEKIVFTDATLRLYMEQSSLYGQGDHENLQIMVNDREVSTSLGSASISIYPKHVDYELGQYMYPGLNVIELSMDAFSTRDWLLQTAEIWIR